MYLDKSFWINFIITNHTRMCHSVMAWNKFWLKQSWNNLGCPECVPEQFDLRGTSRFSRLTCSNEINIAVLSDPWVIVLDKNSNEAATLCAWVWCPLCVSAWLYGNPCWSSMFVHLYILLCLLYYLQWKCSFNVLSVFFNISSNSRVVDTLTEEGKPWFNLL